MSTRSSWPLLAGGVLVSGLAVVLLPHAARPVSLAHAATSAAPATLSSGSSPEPSAPLASAPFGSRVDAPHDPWADTAVDAAACRDALTSAGVVFRALPDRQRPDARGCGIPHAVMVTKGPTGIAYNGPLMVDCSLALELPRIERVLQDQAMASFGEPITRVTTLGSYSCRGKIGSARRGLSEHALGNAMDLAIFHGKGQRVLASVAGHYDPDDKRKPTVARDFLHELQHRLRRETLLTRVIGPDWNASHRDHFHLDRGLPWWWGADR